MLISEEIPFKGCSQAIRGSLVIASLPWQQQVVYLRGWRRGRTVFTGGRLCKYEHPLHKASMFPLLFLQRPDLLPGCTSLLIRPAGLRMTHTTKEIRVNLESTSTGCPTFLHIRQWGRGAQCAFVLRTGSCEFSASNEWSCDPTQLSDLPVTDGRLRSDAKNTNPPWGPGLSPPRGPCESLPSAALRGNILRVLYLHDNTFPKNRL